MPIILEKNRKFYVSKPQGRARHFYEYAQLPITIIKKLGQCENRDLMIIIKSRSQFQPQNASFAEKQN